MKQTGIAIDEQTGDLKIEPTRNSLGLITDGLAIGDVQKQNQAILIYMHAGEMKEAPQVGVGITSALLSSETLLYKHKIREQLEADGFRINHLEISKEQNDKLNIELNAVYQ